MSIVNTEAVSEVIRECVAHYILPRYQKLQSHEISSKTSPRDLVTHADLDVEAHLIKALPGFLPGSIVIGEEGTSGNPQILEKLKDADQDIWVVDPVDGTNNFVHGKREFGVMLALISRGVVRNGWIYDVLGEEMTVAELGHGVFANGKKLSVQAAKNISEMSGHINPGFFPKEYREHIKNARNQFANCWSIACAAHEYLRVARGEAQFSVYTRLKPWDHLAGSLIVKEAGGHIAKWDGTAYNPGDQGIGLIAASDVESWQKVYQAFILR